MTTPIDRIVEGPCVSSGNMATRDAVVAVAISRSIKCDCRNDSHRHVVCRSTKLSARVPSHLVLKVAREKKEKSNKQKLAEVSRTQQLAIDIKRNPMLFF